MQHVAHIREDDTPNTVCGYPWQGWQAPKDYDGQPESPYWEPIPHVTVVHQCPACLKCVLKEKHNA